MLNERERAAIAALWARKVADATVNDCSLCTLGPEVGDLVASQDDGPVTRSGPRRRKLMREFAPRTTTFRGRVTVRSEIEDAFPLFSPAGEKLWVPAWDPEFLQPSEAAWEQGQIFRTREEKGEAVWIVTRLDRAQHHVEYHRVEPGRYVARITVTCRSSAQSRTEVATTYTYIGLSEDGNREIAAMTQRDYDAKMVRWTEWIDRHLEVRARERRG